MVSKEQGTWQEVRSSGRQQSGGGSSGGEAGLAAAGPPSWLLASCHHQLNSTGGSCRAPGAQTELTRLLRLHLRATSWLLTLQAGLAPGWEQSGQANSRGAGGQRCCGNAVLMQRLPWHSLTTQNVQRLIFINSPLALSSCHTSHSVLSCTAHREDSGAASASRGGEDQAMWWFDPCLLGCPADCFAEKLVLPNSTE